MGSDSGSELSSIPKCTDDSVNEDPARPERPECRIKQAGTANLANQASYRTKASADLWADLLVIIRLLLEIWVFANKFSNRPYDLDS